MWEEERKEDTVGKELKRGRTDWSGRNRVRNLRPKGLRQTTE